MKKINENNIYKAIKTIPQVFSLLVKCDRTYLLIMILEVIAFSIDKYPALLIMKYTISALTTQISYNEYLYTILPLVAIMLGLKLMRVYVNTSRPVRDQVITEKIFNSFFTQCMKMDYQTLESKEMQDKKELAKYIANGKIAAIGWYFVEMFSSLIALIIATVFLITISPVVLLIVIIGLILKAYITKRHLNVSTPINKQQVLDDRYLNYLYSIGSEYDYVKEFRIFSYKDKLSVKLKTSKEKYQNLNKKLQNYNFIQSVFYNAEEFIIKLSTFAIMGFYCLRDIVTLSDFTFVIGLINDYIFYTNSLTASCKSYIEATSYIEHYNQFMSEGISNSKNRTETKNINSVQSHSIEFINVSFKYPNSDEFALKDINLKIDIPTKISLVGRNGAGKTTLIKLMLRLYHPNCGVITLDGKDIYEYSERDYESIFSSVFQDFVLFAFTIEENITSLNAPNFDRLYKTSDDSGVSEFLNNYSEKYQTYVTNAYSNDGVEFSGGEQQKIALARSLYKEEAVYYILDEPTATYDADAEYKLYEKYEELLSRKASIFISHRLSSCKLSDKIILLNEGKIAEQGTHDELMNKCGMYYKMFELQAKQYKKGGRKDD